MIRALWKVVRGVLADTVPDVRPEDAVFRTLRAEQRIAPVGPYSHVNPSRRYNVKRRKRPAIEHTVTSIRRRRA